MFCDYNFTPLPFLDWTHQVYLKIYQSEDILGMLGHLSLSETKEKTMHYKFYHCISNQKEVHDDSSLSHDTEGGRR